MMHEKTEKDLATDLHYIAHLLSLKGYENGSIVNDLRKVADRLWEMNNGKRI